MFPPLKTESDALLHLDVLRLVAAWAIVIAHFWHNLDLSPAALQAWARLDKLAIFVDVFFVVSGIVIAWVYGNRMASWIDYGCFLQKRAARLFPLHWATLLFYVGVGLVAVGVGETVAPGRYDESCLLPNALLLHASGICRTTSYNDVSWSISAEMFLYLFFPALLMIQRRWAPSLFVLTGLTVVALFMFDMMSPGSRAWWNRTFDGGVFRALPGFFLGMSAYAYRLQLAAFAHWRLVAAVAFLICIGGVLADAPEVPLVASAYVLAIALFGCDLRGRSSRLVRWLAPGSQLTYSLYMLHPVVGVVFIKVVGVRVMGLSDEALAAWVLLALPISAGVAYVCSLWFEFPLRRRLGRMTIGRGATRRSGSVPTVS